VDNGGGSATRLEIERQGFRQRAAFACCMADLFLVRPIASLASDCRAGLELAGNGFHTLLSAQARSEPCGV
jgi:hypothetical protein